MAGAPPFSRAQALSFNSEHLLRTENIPFDIDNWYPALSEFTFETQFIPMSRLEARAIITYYRARFLRHRGAGFTQADADALDALESHVDAVVRTAFGDTGCFMRLCGRSAKDAEPLDRARVRREFADSLSELGGGGDGKEAADDATARRMRAAARVGVQHARSGADVMSLLLTSERVYSDLLDWCVRGRSLRSSFFVSHDRRRL